MTLTSTRKRSSGILVLIPLLFLLSTFPPSSRAEENWAVILRDAQMANRAALSRGHATMFLDCRPDVRKEAASIEVEIAWSGEAFFSKARKRDPQGVLGDRIAEPLEAQPWQLRLNDKIYYYVYNPITHMFFIHRPAAADNNPYLILHPFRAWLGCPPGRSPTPLADLIGSFRQPPGEKPSTFEFVRVSDDIVRQVRHDAYSGYAGGRFEMDFDMSKGGNIIRFEYMLPPRKDPISQATYRWRKKGTAWVPVSIRYTGLSVDGTGRPCTEELSLRVRSVDLRGEPASYFTKERLLKELPEDTLIDDRVRGRRYPLHPGHKVGVRTDPSGS